MLCIVVMIMLTCCMAYDKNKYTQFQQKMEKDTIELAGEVEQLYKSRCNSINGCSKGNYNDCFSELSADKECANSKVNFNETCGDNTKTSCSIFLDYSKSVVSLPYELTPDDNNNNNPKDPKVIESICFTRALDKWFIQKRNTDKSYWERHFNGVHPQLMYFGSIHGSFRSYPAKPRENCTGLFDPRERPWYIAASSGPKNVVMILDKSLSMKDSRIELLKDAAKRIVNTLTVGDRVAIILFDSKTEVVPGKENWFTANDDSKKKLTDTIDKIVLGEGNNFTAAFEAAFDLLDSSLDRESAVGCNTAILLFTDGETAPNDNATTQAISYVQLRQNKTEQLAKKPIFVFTYSIEEGQGTDSFPSNLSCSIKNSVWSKIDSKDEIVGSLTSYYRLFAFGLSEGLNTNFTTWVEPYRHSFFNLNGTTVAAPVYDRSKKPALFLGVVGISFALEALDIAIGAEGSADDSISTIRDFVLHSKPKCSVINLTTCELESYRQQGSAGTSALCGSNCSDSDFVQVEEEQCPAIPAYPIDLWTNIHNKDIEFEDRACCSTDPSITFSQCLDGNALSRAEKITIWILGSVVGIALFYAIVFILCQKCRRTNVMESSDEDFDVFYPPIPPPPPTAPVKSYVEMVRESNSANIGSN